MTPLKGREAITHNNDNRRNAEAPTTSIKNNDIFCVLIASLEHLLNKSLKKKKRNEDGWMIITTSLNMHETGPCIVYYATYIDLWRLMFD